MALDAIAAVEQRGAVGVADRWFHDQPAPDVPGSAGPSESPLPSTISLRNLVGQHLHTGAFTLGGTKLLRKIRVRRACSSLCKSPAMPPARHVNVLLPHIVLIGCVLVRWHIPAIPVIHGFTCYRSTSITLGERWCSQTSGEQECHTATQEPTSPLPDGSGSHRTSFLFVLRF